MYCCRWSIISRKIISRKKAEQVRRRQTSVFHGKIENDLMHLGSERMYVI